MNPKSSSKILSAAALILASSSFTHAASIVVNTVGTMNGNARTITEATGNSFTATTFATNMTTAFANNTGGVWNFDGTAFNVANGETITLNYGVSQANNVVMTLSATNSINQGGVAGEATSGATQMGLNGDGSTRTFTPSKPLVSIGIFSLDRNTAATTSSISVTFLDNTTASTSGANGDFTYFQGLSASGTNYIKSFSINQSNFIRYDDLGFVVASAVPEPASAATLVGLAAVGFVALRRRRAKA